MHTFSVSSEYILDSTASLNLTLATAISSSAPTSAPAPNAAPLPPTDTPTVSLPAVGVGKDVTIDGIAVKKEIYSIPTAIEESLVQIRRRTSRVSLQQELT